MKKYRQLFRRELALALVLLIALSGMCAQASTGVGGGRFWDSDDAEYELLARGDSGEAVEALQQRLIELGYLSGRADGDYGPKTERAVEAFQREAGLEETGEADPETQEALFEADAPEASFAVEEREYASMSAASSGSGVMVWIPKSGKKYHSSKSCSNMKNPSQVTIEEAERLGFEPCKKCYG